jgi:hypothetical protein
MKNLCLLLQPLFFTQDKDPGSEIRDEQILGSESGIKHPGSATLILITILQTLRTASLRKCQAIIKNTIFADESGVKCVQNRN